MDFGAAPPSDSMDFAQSYAQAQGHGKSFIKSTIGQHPTTAAIILSVLVVLVLVLAFVAVHFKNKMKSGFEGLATGPSACPAGMTAVTYTYPAHQAQDGYSPDGTPRYKTVPGGTSTECVSAGSRADLGDDSGLPSACGQWDPAASAEAQALATVGSLQHDSHGERKLQSAINVAYDGNVGISNAELQELMHQGGTP